MKALAVSQSQAERIARVAERKTPLRPAPWHPKIAGTQHWLLADSLTVAALAQGIVLTPLQLQAEELVRCCHLLEEEL